ncbi:MAG: YggS family pyridoxal phosphate-dependent enzyme [Ruminococcus sp.]|nr:YggS family pyridoxal phosphate-dependent enzyme [Ruminococcus sp.]
MESNYSYVDENLKLIRENVGEAAEKCGRKAEDIRIMAVTKTVAPEIVNHAIELGLDLLGENRVQEYLSKAEAYSPAEVHFIGGLQTNKVKYIIESVSMIQSVDSLKLGTEIDRLAAKHGRVMDILCEVNIGGEESKGGVAPDKLRELIAQLARLKNIRIKGLMTIPPPSQSDVFLGRMQELYNDLRDNKIEGADMQVLSMGMTHDYAEAVKYGSTLVRIGTGLFGARDYSRK